LGYASISHAHTPPLDTSLPLTTSPIQAFLE